MARRDPGRARLRPSRVQLRLAREQRPTHPCQSLVAAASEGRILRSAARCPSGPPPPGSFCRIICPPVIGSGRIPLRVTVPPPPRYSTTAASTPHVFPRFLADPCHPAIRETSGDSLIPIGPTLPRERPRPRPCPPRSADQPQVARCPIREGHPRIRWSSLIALTPSCDNDGSLRSRRAQRYFRGVIGTAAAFWLACWTSCVGSAWVKESVPGVQDGVR